MYVVHGASYFDEVYISYLLIASEVYKLCLDSGYTNRIIQE
nr:MAG TPA_asm: hypothetical protein [Caudoviricetes sp.]